MAWGAPLARFRWATLYVGLGRGDVDVDHDAPREVRDWVFRPAVEYERVAGSRWVELWAP